ncbi:TetR/AcrR family transcriptional regulator [Sanguibacter sp. HDW7]|uniref:TetR/AcrR family transcriptional regulator n=1 Tax=Sanguibacter sp. HDW7 TaxID=2714931 RepID=UPI00140A8699|nr:TetR/AcrR family transcriptional regulator [Sanguibacter sp. HDW7]QIK84670.1 TetR/AcrR family transcriptional regulator [Sanguibacter sp. HDW7]
MTETAPHHLPTGARPLRSDARRNRRRLLEAATAVFVEHGPDAPLDEVARVAGVGPGTLYRHFSGRDDLLAAVLEGVVERVLTSVREARATEPTAWDALVRATGWSPPLRVALHLARGVPDGASPTLRASIDEVLDVLDGLVAAAQAEGALRDDVTTGDVVLLAAATSRTLPLDPAAAENAFRRAHALVLAGLRSGATAPLPGTPVALDDLPL